MTSHRRPIICTWVVVLVKDFETAKQRLAAAIEPDTRRELARQNAVLALTAAQVGDRVLAVAGSAAAAELARVVGVEVLLESNPAGQNAAAYRGIHYAQSYGAEAVLLLSSDLPLVNPDALKEMLESGRAIGPTGVMAAPAAGRGGTNALYLQPPNAISLHFGDNSLMKFEQEAKARGVPFAIFESDALALDLDEPSDLMVLASILMRADSGGKREP